MTAVVTPTRTHEQRMAGLARANAIRTFRAEVKRNLRAGADPVAILRNPAPEMATMRVSVFLLSLPKWGNVKVARFMNRSRIAQSKTLAGLSERQRAGLIEVLGR